MNQLCTFDAWYTACLWTSMGTIAASRIAWRSAAAHARFAAALLEAASASLISFVSALLS
jgi:hypothetical protein